MKPIFENIDVAVNTSFKIETYIHSTSCSLTGWHIHPEYELVYIKNGSGTLRINHKTIPYYNGALLFIGPNIPHADFGNKEHLDNYEVVIQFGKDFITEKLQVFPEFTTIRGLIRDAKYGIIFNEKTKNKLAQIFENFDKSNSTKSLLSLLSILHTLSIFSNDSYVLDNHLYRSSTSEDVKRLETIFDYINEHYKEKITTNFIADMVGLTPNSLCRFFKKMTHTSIIQFVNEYRIRRAIELCNDYEYSITEIMYLCGYSDPSYFGKQFKKYNGTTPSAYRNSLS